MLSPRCLAALFKTHWSSINTFNCFLWFSWLNHVAFQGKTVFLTLLRSWVYPARRARGKNESPTFCRKENTCDYLDRARFLKVPCTNEGQNAWWWYPQFRVHWNTKHTITKSLFLLLKNKDVLNNKLSFLVSSWSEFCTAQNMAQLSAVLCNRMTPISHQPGMQHCEDAKKQI